MEYKALCDAMKLYVANTKGVPYDFKLSLVPMYDKNNNYWYSVVRLHFSDFQSLTENKKSGLCEWLKGLMPLLYSVSNKVYLEVL